MVENNKMYSYKYPHPAVTADCVIFGFDGVSIKVLLIQRGIEPYKDSGLFLVVS
jgi:8-oxo-dGTP diphosphatase